MMNAKTKNNIGRNFERASSQLHYDGNDPTSFRDCYSHYDLEWIAFVSECRKRKDNGGIDKITLEVLPNVWNTPRH